MLNPIIKWSGSKRSQAEKIASLITKKYETYYESFCGGCSVLFYILNNCPDTFKRFICNDINKSLIDTFILIKTKPNEILNSYSTLWKELNKDSDLERKKDIFALIRERFNKSHNPSLFFFIMRTTTNGMPRYNKEGDFNNSFHVTRNGILPNKLKPILEDWSYKLNAFNVSFTSSDYKEINPSEKDFMYLDPPYAKTKGMYYGTIDYNQLWDYLRKCPCDYFLSFDGIAGKENNIANIPEDLYTKHYLLNSGNSSFRRVIGNSNNTYVLESLYLRIKDA